MRSFVKGWENFCNKLESPEVEEKMIVIWILGICLTRSAKFYTIEVFRSRMHTVHFGRWNDIFVV